MKSKGAVLGNISATCYSFLFYISRHYSDKQHGIIPIALIIFRKGGILFLDWSDDYVYDREAGSRKMGAV